jgi:hypothetical protein
MTDANLSCKALEKVKHKAFQTEIAQFWLNKSHTLIKTAILY